MPDLFNSLRNQKKATQPREVLISGNLGVKLNGSEVVQIPGRPGFVYVRLLSSDSELIQAYNGVVSPTYDLPVLVVWDVNKYRIKGRDILRYQDWGESPYLPLHGSTHSFDKSGQSGGDVVWVKSEQFYPFATYPSGTAGSENIAILPYTYLWNGVWKYGGNTGTPDITSLRPATSGKVRLMLLCINGDTSNPHFITGSIVDDTLNNYELVQYYPAVDTSEDIPLAIVRIETGTTSIGWDDLYDVRQYFGSTPTGTSGGGGVSGPGSSTDNALAAFDGTGGNKLKNTTVIYDPSTGKITCKDTSGVVIWEIKPASNSMVGWGYDGSEPYIDFNTAGGTPGSLAALGDGDYIGDLTFHGYNGTLWKYTAHLLVVSNEQWDSTKHGTKMEIYLTPTGSNTMGLACTIDGSGNMNLKSGGTYNVGGVLHKHNSVTGSFTSNDGKTITVVDGLIVSIS